MKASVTSQPGLTAVLAWNDITAVVSNQAANLGYTLAITGTGTSRTATITMNRTGYFLFRIWLTDSATAPGTQTLNPPSGDTTTEWWECTASTGVLTKTITHTGAATTWYVNAVLIGEVGISDEVAFT